MPLSENHIVKPRSAAVQAPCQGINLTGNHTANSHPPSVLHATSRSLTYNSMTHLHVFVGFFMMRIRPSNLGSQSIHWWVCHVMAIGHWWWLLSHQLALWPLDIQWSCCHCMRSMHADVQVVMRDAVTKKPRGFGFITFTEAGAADAVCRDTHTIDNRQVCILLSNARLCMARQLC